MQTREAEDGIMHVWDISGHHRRVQWGSWLQGCCPLHAAHLPDTSYMPFSGGSSQKGIDAVSLRNILSASALGDQPMRFVGPSPHELFAQ